MRRPLGTVIHQDPTRMKYVRIGRAIPTIVMHLDDALSMMDECTTVLMPGMPSPYSFHCTKQPPWYNHGAWRDARAAEWGGLENRCSLWATVGSNPTLSADTTNCNRFVVTTRPSVVVELSDVMSSSTTLDGFWWSYKPKKHR